MTTGENLLQNATEQFEGFKKSVDDYIELKGIQPISFSEDFRLALNLDIDIMDKLTQQECFNYAYTLYQYAGYIQDEHSQQQVVVDWCNSRLNYIIANSEDCFPQYTKHEMKVPLLIKENSFASKVESWRLVAESRLKRLEGKEILIKRKADCLMEKGKRR
tara:strand:- start:11932 stop:12414 length:483 start_codon:yes stop_codon:yes gene_type:complete